MSESSTSRSGIGVAGLLGVAFVILKLCGVIAWSWWWVLAPFWIPAGIGLVILVIVGIVILIAAFAGNKTPRANRALRNYERSVRPWH